MEEYKFIKRSIELKSLKVPIGNYGEVESAIFDPIFSIRQVNLKDPKNTKDLREFRIYIRELGWVDGIFKEEFNVEEFLIKDSNLAYLLKRIIKKTDVEKYNILKDIDKSLVKKCVSFPFKIRILPKENLLPNTEEFSDIKFELDIALIFNSQGQKLYQYNFI